MDIIIGAGATGLAYASFTKNDYLIVEADSEEDALSKADQIFPDDIPLDDWNNDHINMDEDDIRNYSLPLSKEVFIILVNPEGYGESILELFSGTLLSQAE